MPQLDVLTYFTQFFYLLISFLTTYLYANLKILPSVVSVFKLRQKLNSIAFATSKLEHSAFSVRPVTAAQSSLLKSYFYECSKQYRSWLESALTSQLSHALKRQKLLSIPSIRTFSV